MALGTAVFLFFFGMAFWLLLFLFGFVGLWTQWGSVSIMKANLAKRGIINIDEESFIMDNTSTEKTPVINETSVDKGKSLDENIDDVVILPREKTHHLSKIIKSKIYFGFGLSVQGKSHKKNPPIPCQDYHSLGTVNDKYHYAIVSDGAGSGENSHIGSKIACEGLSKLIKKYLEKVSEEEFQKLDNPKWYKVALRLFEKTREELIGYAQKNEMDLNSLKCTLILIVQTPRGIFTANVGDGRAGYLSKRKYSSVIVPFQTYVVGSTIFLTKENWNQFFMTSLHENIHPDAFFAISDGCDDFSFLLKGEVPAHEKGVYDKVYSEARYDHNQPFAGFYDALIGQIYELKEKKEEEAILPTVEKIIDLGIFKEKPIAGIQKEEDDKTMVIFLNNQKN